MNRSDVYQNIIEKAIKITGIFNDLDKTARDYGNGELLHTAEIHTIEMIGMNEGINVTTLAQKLGITKGAVSQIVKRLEKKSLVNRYKGDHNNQEVLLRLEEKGKIAHMGHEQFHRELYQTIIKELNEMGDDNLSFLLDLVGKIEAAVSRHK